MNLVCIRLAGPAVLTVLRRAARKARFQAPVRFRPRTPAAEDTAQGRSAP
ncbi:hypothetical protein Slala05_70330 [Streptomyces lavendulae subsp. lavendulae]|nr:hypothetical protein Slala05_70330 [Streptomyces lavendulae subsp. lavendulae]